MLLKYKGGSIKAKIPLPGSKSISNRCLILKEILDPGITLQNLSTATDTKDLVEALAQIRENKLNSINIGHAGTDMRFLTAFLSITKGEWLLHGSERMNERPVRELVDALRGLGADISYTENQGFPPLKIIGKQLEGGKVSIDAGISSQFISALLLIAPAFSNGLEITLTGTIVSWPYIRMTIDLLNEFGVDVSYAGQTISVKPVNSARDQIRMKEYFIESDWSAASYWYSMAALSTGADLTLSILHEKSAQGDSVLQNIYEKFGITTIFKNGAILLAKKPIDLSSFEYNCNDCPDLAQTIAVTCLGLGINCKLTGLSTLKYKETDRLLAMKTELEKFKVSVSISNQTLELIHAPGAQDKIQDAGYVTINTYNDHRMALSFAPLVLCFSEIRINNPDVIKKSYPEFWDQLAIAGIETR